MERYNDNNYYVDAIKFIRNKYNPNLKICIFSQGQREHFKEFLNDEHITLYLDGDWRIVHHSLVKASILVTSISEFAWTAGILSEGEVYKNLRMFRGPLAHWQTIHHAP